MTAFAQRSSQERLWIVGGAIGALLLLLIGWVLLIAPQRSDTDAVNSDADTVRTSNLELQSRISTLRAESKDMTGVKKSLAAAQQALPSTSGVPDFLRSLQALGNSTGTDVVSLTVGQPADVSKVATGAAASGAPTTAPASSAPGSVPGASTAPTGGVFALTIAAQVNGPTDRLGVFLSKLQTVQPRAVLVTHITQGSTEASNGTTLQLTMQAFVSPVSAAEQAQLAKAAAN